MTRATRIKPHGKDWMIRFAPQVGPTDHAHDLMIFDRGAAAEAAARLMAEALAKSGEAVQVLVHLPDGALAGRYDSGRGGGAPRFEPAIETSWAARAKVSRRAQGNRPTGLPP